MKINQARRVRYLSQEATIGIFSPSEPIVETRQERFNKGLSILTENGFRFKLGKNCLAISAYTAGSIEERLEDIHTLARDTEIDALMASWGGKSCNQLIRYLNYEELADARKPILAFSDGCVLLNAITAVTGLITFHGPNVVGKLDETKHSNLGILIKKGTLERTNLLGSPSPGSTRVIRGGKATGKLFGGNLSTFVLGTVCSNLSKHLWEGGIFFWEEASMPPQLIEQHLRALINTGLLDRIAGMIVGNFLYEDPLEWKRIDGLSSLSNILSEFSYPILYCPTFGHAPLENPILPIGASCTLDADAVTLQVIEQIAE